MDLIARNPKQIGAAIRRHRRATCFSQVELGASAGLRQATISALESGEPGTQLRTLTDVMAALGLELVIRERTKASKDIEEVF